MEKGQEEEKTNKTENNNSIRLRSGLSYIDFSGSDPFELFMEWYKEVREDHLVNPDTICLSTCSKEGKPSSRFMFIQCIEEDGFVMMTDSRSRKAIEMTENPYASVAFLWSYRKDNHRIHRQVRVDGHVEEVPQSEYSEIWHRKPLFVKIRSNICKQGHPVDWEEHKRAHDSLYEDVITNEQEPSLPQHVKFYKVIATYMEFYYTYDNNIGDRLTFQCSDNNVWKAQRVAS